MQIVELCVGLSDFPAKYSPPSTEIQFPCVFFSLSRIFTIVILRCLLNLCICLRFNTHGISKVGLKSMRYTVFLPIMPEVDTLGAYSATLTRHPNVSTSALNPSASIGSVVEKLYLFSFRFNVPSVSINPASNSSLCSKLAVR